MTSGSIWKGANGDWIDPVAWTDGVPTDSAFFTLPGSYVAAVGQIGTAETVSIGTLTLDAAGATVAVGPDSRLEVTGALILDAGTLTGGIVGLDQGILEIVTDQTLGGTALGGTTLHIDNSDQQGIAVGPDATLTLGPDLTVVTTGETGFDVLPDTATGGTIINQGTIDVANGVLQIHTAFQNPGSLVVAPGAWFELVHDMTTDAVIAALRNVSVDPGHAYVVGNIDNRGSTIDLAPGGPFEIADYRGTIEGGTLRDAGGTFGLALGGAFDAVTWIGPVVLDPGNSFGIVNGITLLGQDGRAPGTIDMREANLRILSDTTLEHAELILEPGPSYHSDEYIEVYGTLTLGPDLTVHMLGSSTFAWGEVVNDTSLDTGTAGGFSISSGSFVNNAGVTIRSSSDLGSLTNNGSIAVLGDVSVSVGSLSNAGALRVGDGGTLVLWQAVQDAGRITVQNAAELRAWNTISGGTIVGFNTADRIVFPAVRYSAAVTAQYADGTLTVENGTSLLARLEMPGDFGGDDFVVRETSTSAVEVDLVTCFAHGTRIATPSGEVRVEHLRIGDAVLTASGAARPVKWIGRRAYDERFIAGNRNVLPIRIRSGALGENVPVRDLLVSPHHAMFVGGVLVPAEKLVNGVSIVQEAAVERIEYFHIELDSHDVLLAEGAAAESFVDCDSRGLFANAAEFALLYPDDDTPRWQFCVPRVEDGPALASIRARIAERAGIRLPDVPGVLRGQVDRIDRSGVAGWARDEGDPNHPVALVLRIDGEVVAELLAQAQRPDLEAEGMGEGRHGFRIQFAMPLDGRPHLLSLRRAVDGAELPGSPVLLAPASRGELGAVGLDVLLGAARRLTLALSAPARISARTR